MGMDRRVGKVVVWFIDRKLDGGDDCSILRIKLLSLLSAVPLVNGSKVDII